ncbi:integrase [Bifidobacterium sp. DSM 109958]|uniref:Integrase n=1 Tax=Bifidobacterium moraviense TaxID=2675323 RepID=A0A7Y0HZZ6_9BIFI|nr:site-specific integrase [Bifidobacterium sp. DSM 109958]NMN01329.1 integrase [Bifidobacterium sp. DSM 109958]
MSAAAEPQTRGVFRYPCKKFPKGVAYGFRYKGVRRRGFERRTDAERERSRVIADMSAGRYIDPQRGKATVGELGRAWLETKHGVIKQASYDKYEDLWRCHVEPRWGGVPVSGVCHGDVQRWIGDISARYSGKQTQSILSVLSMVMKAAVKDKRIAENPCEDIELPRVKVSKPRRYLTMRQLLALGEAASDRRRFDYGTMVLFMGTTGMRFGETTALRVRHLDLDKGTALVCENSVWSGSGWHLNTAKNGEDRMVVFPKGLLRERLSKAVAFKDPDALVFERPGSLNDGRHLAETDYMRPPDSRDGWFATAVRAAGLPHMTLHDLRHTAVSLAVHAKVPPKVVQAIAGHKTFSMTMDYYADLFTDDLFGLFAFWCVWVVV